MSAPRFPALDGLRGIAVISVVLFHLWPHTFPAGFLGVNLFFVLSGFLVTRAFTESTAHSKIEVVRGFWKRRVLRLLPAEFLMLGSIWMVWLLSGWWSSSLGRELNLSILQILNWRIVLTPDYYANFPTAVSHLWSLAIEIQLYLLLTVVMLLASQRRVVVTCLCATSILMVAAMEVSGLLSHNVIYASTFSRSAEFCMGVLLTLWWRQDREMHTQQVTAQRAVLLGLVGGFWFLVLREGKDGVFVNHGGLVFVGMIACGAVWISLTLGEKTPRWLSKGMLPSVGKVSYGIYLYHWPLFVGLSQAGVGDGPRQWLTLLGTVVLATTSFRYFERPVQQWGQRTTLRQGQEAIRTTQ